VQKRLEVAFGTAHPVTQDSVVELACLRVPIKVLKPILGSTSLLLELRGLLSDLGLEEPPLLLGLLQLPHAGRPEVALLGVEVQR
jgi:hypothetical protein